MNSKTKNSIPWYVNNDNNIMIATDSYGCSDGSTAVTYTALTRSDLIKMLANTGADVRRKRDGCYERITVKMKEVLDD